MTIIRANTVRCFVFATLVTGAGGAAADVFKCAGGGGTPVYQESPSRQTCTMEPVATAGVTGTIKAAQLTPVWRNDTTGPNCNISIKIGAVDYDLTNDFNISTSYTMHGWCDDAPPPVSGLTAWTSTIVDTLEVGVRRAAFVGGNVTRVSQLTFQVEYDDGSLVDITGMGCTPFESDYAADPESIVICVATESVWVYSTGAAWNTFRTGVTSGKRLEAVHYNNQYVLANGTDTQKVFKSDFSTINHGMAPFTDATHLTLGTTAGTWQNVAGLTYWYSVTEYDATNDIENITETWSGRVGLNQGTVGASVNIRIASQYGQAAYPTLKNSNATKWRIYRSEGTDGLLARDDPFPTYFLVTEVTIPGTPAVTNYDDDGSVEGAAYRAITISVDGSASVSFSTDDTPPIFTTGRYL